jgi:hypothetical protein
MFKPSTLGTNRGAQKIVAKDSGKRKCVICLEEFDKKYLIQLRCTHRWCASCINDAFSAATKYRPSYPPRCCQEIKVDHVCSHLKVDVRKRFQSKKLEWDCVNPTYCRNPRCSMFLDQSRIRGMEATCPKPDCGKKTCIKCKMTAHGTSACSKKEEDSRTRAMAAEWNWKRCPKCHIRVELSEGCAITA